MDTVTKPTEYEITYLIDPNTAEEGRAELNTGIDAKITELAGKVAVSSAVLRRRLAYPIIKTDSAFIRTVHIELAPEHVEEIRMLLKKTKDVMRFTILRTHKREGVPAELLERTRGSKGDHKKKDVRKAAPAKKVTMEDVEKGIEEALTEEVK